MKQKQCFTLTLASSGEKLKIIKINGDREIVKHLGAMGVISNTYIKVIEKQSNGIIIQVRGAKLVLGNEICSGIIVAKEKSQELEM